MEGSRMSDLTEKLFDAQETVEKAADVLLEVEAHTRFALERLRESEHAADLESVIEALEDALKRLEED